jgi:DNA-binding transcriptional LysR family regulator
MLSMRALGCLVTIVEQGSLTKAATTLHMSLRLLTLALPRLRLATFSTP